MATNKVKVFGTIDMGLASTLSAKGFQIIKTEMINRAVNFYFEKDDEIEDVARDYYMGQVLINAKDLVAEVKKARKIIGAHLSNAYGPMGLAEKEIEHTYEDEEEPTKKPRKGKEDKIIIGNDGYTSL